MGKYLSIIIGTITTILGLLGLVKWWGDLLLVLKGSLPVMLILTGVVAVIAGISEINDEIAAAKKEKT